MKQAHERVQQESSKLIDKYQKQRLRRTEEFINHRILLVSKNSGGEFMNEGSSKDLHSDTEYAERHGAEVKEYNVSLPAETGH